MDPSFNNSIQQTTHPKLPPLLDFKRQKEDIKKDSVEQNTTEKGFSDNRRKNTGISIQKVTLQYNPLNIDRLIDYYRQTSQQLTQLLIDNLKLQKYYINAFQPQWVDHMRTNLENYLVFQDKIIHLYIQYYNTCLITYLIKGTTTTRDGEIREIKKIFIIDFKNENKIQLSPYKISQT